MRVLEPEDATPVGALTRHAWPAEVLDDGSGLVALRLPLPVGTGTPYVANGWQSWSAAARRRLGDGWRRPPAPSRRVGRRHLLECPPYQGDESYDVLVADGFVAGVVEHGAVLVARPDRGDLLAVCEAPGPYPDVFTGTGDADALLAELLDHADGRDGQEPPVGWCSWYGLWEHVDERRFRAQLQPAREHGIEVVLVDDGWQRSIGDWVPNRVFPSGMTAVADRAAALGLEAGLWCAPFCASPDADVVHLHPEWVLRDAAGAPVTVIDVAHWGGPVFALDVSRPDVRDWVSWTMRRFVHAGFRHLKLDFLFAAALPGARTVPMNGATALRAGIEAVREGAGEGTWITACGSPLWPAIGLVDAMRVGPDAVPRWAPESVPGLEPGMIACVRNAWRAAELRSSFDGRLWANDPDCITLRRTDTALAVREADEWAGWVADHGQVLTLSDPFESLGAHDLDRWASVLDRWRAARRGAERGERTAGEAG